MSKVSGKKIYATTRIRYFTNGVAIGTKAYVDGLFAANRVNFGLKRTSGARKLRSAEWGELRNLRDLRKEAVGGG